MATATAAPRRRGLSRRASSAVQEERPMRFRRQILLLQKDIISGLAIGGVKG